MKKYILALFVFSVSLGVSKASDEMRGAPVDRTGAALQFSDYGGYEMSTSAFSSALTTATLNGSGVFRGIWFSTGSITLNGFPDSVDVWDSTSANQVVNITPIRIYNDTNYALSVTTACGFRGPPAPFRYKRGLLWKPSVATYNSIILMHSPDNGK